MICSYSLKHSDGKLGEPLLGTELEDQTFYKDNQFTTIDMWILVLGDQIRWIKWNTEDGLPTSISAHHSNKKYPRFCPFPKNTVITFTQDQT